MNQSICDIGKEVEKNCDWCGKPLFMWCGNPSQKGYHTKCRGEARRERERSKYAKMKNTIPVENQA